MRYSTDGVVGGQGRTSDEIRRDAKGFWGMMLLGLAIGAAMVLVGQ